MQLYCMIQITKDLMMRTYVFRRAEIINGGIPLDNLFLMYPPLKEADEVFNNIKQ